MSGTHAAVVLAAGGSARLGSPKQLLTRDGETLVHRAARLAMETSPRQLIVVLGAHGDAVAQVLHDLPCTLVRNSGWQAGLAGSLAAAAAHLSDETARVLILACDQPALERVHLQTLLDGAATATARCAAAWHGDVPGVPAVVPRAWFDDTPAPAGDRGFGQRLGQLPAAAVFALHAVELGFDIDTRADVERARLLGWLDAGT